MKEQMKTTKEILHEKLSERKTTPLYSPEALESIRQTVNQWMNSTVREKDRKNWLKTPHTVLRSDIPREMLYTPLANAGLDYQADLGHSGQEPFTRGIHANMYRGREFTMRQLTGFGSPEDTNRRMKFMVDHGATGLNILFDLPTIQMYDSDDPMSAGQVGMSGVCVDSVEDMDLLFKDLPLDEVSVSIVTHYPSNTAILFPMFLVLAEERGIPWDRLRGSVQNDVTLEELIRSGAEYTPPHDCFRIQCDNIQFIRENIPQWNFITLNGYNLREFGTSGVTEMAVAVANGIETLEEMVRRGYDVDAIADRLAFFWSPASDFFEEVSRLRAVRRLWFKIMKYRFNATNPRSMWMRCHVQTSGVSLVQQEPLNNIIRSAYHALSAVFGGAQSLHVDSYDEAYSVPTEEAALLSLRTQQIIQRETGITDVVDPLGGSFYVEALTNEIEKRILDEVDEIEREGGYVAAIESGKLHKKIATYFFNQQREIEEGKIKIVACNIYNSDTEPPPINVFQYPEGVEERQKAKLARLRLKRDSERVNSALKGLKEACKKRKNILPYSIDCARARCTEGELFKVFKEAYGLWEPPTLW
ncbi:MAG: methylmalonyl-CoA mutase [Deltaproteobacteria bacterium]|nr:methylmalonyl-CoA mutase [Deltaproteobacteria bacterium]MBW2049148.1 methylmalonyl-CoA mutase [Deltaproteobacteria bacterium]MBW2112770.1 methylmalonyl-CoA mutase [Deltaproteobacteria bacterium]MBW2354876.1 methylmalonyl-CoA mutase [Deltaproteobacteria bacterium]HDZ23636.1 methylmalonyl-CoA mutase [Desulfobacteraceae bacterium]